MTNLVLGGSKETGLLLCGLVTVVENSEDLWRRVRTTTTNTTMIPTLTIFGKVVERDEMESVEELSRFYRERGA